MKIELSKELREVFEQLIPIYEKAVEELPESKWQDYLIEIYLYSGICCASISILKKHIYREMSKIQIGLWHEIPTNVITRTEAIDCLQWRINKMKELLNKIN